MRSHVLTLRSPSQPKQQEVYFDLLDTTSLIANRITDPKDDLQRAHAMEKFWLLFWDPLPVVANKDVAIAADAFSVALDQSMDFVQLRNASMDLARACRRALVAASAEIRVSLRKLRVVFCP